MKGGAWTTESWNTTSRLSDEADERRENLLAVLDELERRGRRLAQAPREWRQWIRARLPALVAAAFGVGLLWGLRKGATMRPRRHSLPAQHWLKTGTG